ncbi:MAG: peptidoglycan-binding protein, partial [Clostridiales bacterium]|nr:peptidoglycan-binding protein [Clostridiales bacterium]
IHVIEGNNPSAVARNTYFLTDCNILGFGTALQVAGTTMRFGNRGKLVEDFQEKLYPLGYLEKEQISGIFKTSTKMAVKAFQAQYQLKQVGVANMDMQNMLEKVWQRAKEQDLREYIVTQE